MQQQSPTIVNATNMNLQIAETGCTSKTINTTTTTSTSSLNNTKQFSTATTEQRIVTSN